MSPGSEDAVRQIVTEGGEADDILRASVAALTEQAAVGRHGAGVAFLDGGVLGLGPTAGMADESRRTRTPILFLGALVGCSSGSTGPASGSSWRSPPRSSPRTC